MSSSHRCAAAIIAGGKATRMGGAFKPFLTLEGRRIIDRQLDVLAALFSEIYISANDPEPFFGFDLPVVADSPPDRGPLGGILAVLEASKSEHVFVVACDMPFIVPDAVRLVANYPDDGAIIVPVVNGKPEPLFARYSTSCAQSIRLRLASGQRRVTCFHADVAVRVVGEDELRAVDPTLQSLTNVNRPEDLR